jgi:sugar phosphate isomerase/epimerase
MFKCLSPAPLGISAPINDLIEPALSFGFKGLELDIVTFAEAAARTGLPTARRLLDSAGLKLGYFTLPVPLEAPDAEFKKGLESLKSWTSVAAEVGCTRAVATIAPSDDERPMHQNFVVHQQRIGEVARLLDAGGVRLGIGFTATPEARAGRAFEFIRTFDALKLLLGMIGAKNVGLAVDLYELWAAGASCDTVKGEIVGLPGAGVVALFVADAPADVAPADALETGRLLPGETGTIDTTGVLTTLAENGFDGPVVPRPHPIRFKQLARNAIVKLTGEKLDQAWKAAGLNPAGKLVPAKR